MTDTTSHLGDVEAALAAARPLHEEIVHGADPHVLVTATPGQDGNVDICTEDLERYLPKPQRQRGTVRALSADGFVTSFVHRTDSADPAVVYVDVDRTRLVAVLNDDEDGFAGWRDHRITYEPQPTPEWRHWIDNVGLGPQAKFARVIEDGEAEIRTPSATVMLELAETFHASTTAKFKQAGRLRDGRTQLVYEEEIEATAGEGLVEIPQSFTIEVRPFYGAAPVTVECKLRYRLDRGDLTIGYTIIRPDEIVRASFETDVVGAIRDRLEGFPVIDATPAEPVTPGR